MRYTKDSSKEHEANCEPTFKLRAYMFKKPPVEGGFLVYFVRSGRIDLGSGILRHFGDHGFGRSGTAVTYSSPTSAYAYNFTFTGWTAYPSDNYYRYIGFPVRCLVILVYQTADGVTVMTTSMRRRYDKIFIKPQPVSASRGRRGVFASRLCPIIPIKADIPQTATAIYHPPATDVICLGTDPPTGSQRQQKACHKIVAGLVSELFMTSLIQQKLLKAVFKPRIGRPF